MTGLLAIVGMGDPKHLAIQVQLRLTLWRNSERVEEATHMGLRGFGESLRVSGLPGGFCRGLVRGMDRFDLRRG